MTSDAAKTTGTSFRRADRSGRAVSLFWDGDLPAPDGWMGANRSTVDELLDLGLDVESASIDQVYVGPAPGRVDGWKVVSLLEEFRRVLIPDGAIRVAVLDADRVIRAYQTGERAFFWDDPTDELAGALAAQLLEWGSARTVFAPALIGEHLSLAGFEGVRPPGFGESSTTPDLASADRHGDRLCFTEAVNPERWPGAPMPDGPGGIHLGWGDDRCATVGVTWAAQPATEWTLRYRSIGDVSWSEVEPESWPTVDGSLAPHVFHACCTGLEPGRDYEYEVVPSEGTRQAGSAPVPFSTLPREPDVVTFAFFADTGLAGRPDGLCDGVEAIHETIERARPHFVLGGGDYAYKSSDPAAGGRSGSRRGIRSPRGTNRAPCCLRRVRATPSAADRVGPSWPETAKLPSWRRSSIRLDSLLEARVPIEDWRIDYNINRPHTAHGDLTPTEFATHWSTINQPQARIAAGPLNGSPSRRGRELRIDLAIH